MREQKTHKTFSESFKKEKVKLIESGKMTVRQICKLYDVGNSSVYKWKKKYGRLPKDEHVVIEKDSDYKKVLLLLKEIDNMKKLIGEQQIKLDYFQGVVKHATIHYEEDIEKKFGLE
jgi:transposase-like protein